MAQRGCFITLEGLDGAGKSTHAAWMADWLRRAGIDFLHTREPGGTPLGERLRDILLHQAMDLRTEALLMFAARNEHWRTRIQPALAQGQWVLCDRYTDASYAYQGGGRRLGADAIARLEAWALSESGPDCTFLFDVPLAVARTRRLQGRDAPDRFEQEEADFFQRTRQAYLERAAAAPGRFRTIDASQDIPAVQRRLDDDLQALVQAWRKSARS
ncbi:dTMP kinase [Castellaniella hirudinis]|uniref:dTMP kinase n=1 Tax=Castellaniella hirudinis TaxID=1144617 RepID=UPI0039C1B425